VHRSFLYSNVVILTVPTQTMTDALSPSIIKDYVLPTVIGLSEDPIPNIRFNVAKALETLTPSLKQDSNTVDLIESTVVPSLQKLTNDKDSDVRFFASRALLDGKSSSFFISPVYTSLFNHCISAKGQKSSL